MKETSSKSDCNLITDPNDCRIITINDKDGHCEFSIGLVPDYSGSQLAYSKLALWCTHDPKYTNHMDLKQAIEVRDELTNLIIEMIGE